MHLDVADKDFNCAISNIAKGFFSNARGRSGSRAVTWAAGQPHFTATASDQKWFQSKEHFSFEIKIGGVPRSIFFPLG